jgi:hypothetical protein
MGLTVPVAVLVTAVSPEPVKHEAVYREIAEPPVALGAVKATLAVVFPPVAVPIVGVPGVVPGTTLTTLDATLVSLLALVALTLQA